MLIIKEETQLLMTNCATLAICNGVVDLCNRLVPVTTPKLVFLPLKGVVISRELKN